MKLQKTEFTWSKKTQSFILSSYFYGYITTQIPSGWLAAKYNGKLVVGACMTLASLLTLLLPTFARAHVLTLILARAFLGLCMVWISFSSCNRSEQEVTKKTSFRVSVVKSTFKLLQNNYEKKSVHPSRGTFELCSCLIRSCKKYCSNNDKRTLKMNSLSKYQTCPNVITIGDFTTVCCIVICINNLYFSGNGSTIILWFSWNLGFADRKK